MPFPSFWPCFFSGWASAARVGAALARKSLRPGILLGWCQLLLTAAIFWTAYMLAKSLPYWPIDPSLTANAWLNFQLDMARCLWALLPATLFWGASFPLALAAAAARGQDPARLVGGIYAANTVGGILGGIGFSIVFIPWIGTQQQPAAVDRPRRAGRAFDVCHRCAAILENRLARRRGSRHFGFRGAGFFHGGAGKTRRQNSRRTGRLGPLHAEPDGRVRNALRRRGHEQFRGGVEE